MQLEQVKGVDFSHLFTFSPPMKASQLGPIDDRPEPMPSFLNYPAYAKPQEVNLFLVDFSHFVQIDEVDAYFY